MLELLRGFEQVVSWLVHHGFQSHTYTSLVPLLLMLFTISAPTQEILLRSTFVHPHLLPLAAMVSFSLN